MHDLVGRASAIGAIAAAAISFGVACANGNSDTPDLLSATIPADDSGPGVVQPTDDVVQPTPESSPPYEPPVAQPMPDAETVDALPPPPETGPPQADAMNDVTTDGQPPDAAQPEAGPEPSSDGALDAFPPCIASKGCPAQSVCVGRACIPTRRVFVSSATYTGTLGGLSGADSKCKGLAMKAGIGGTWMAWISTPSSTPGMRFTPSSAGYRMLDGTVIAASLTALTSSGPMHAINLDENAVADSCPTSNLNATKVWTATASGGTLVADGCNGFTSGSSGSNAAYGHCDGTSNWTYANNSQSCDRSFHIYCFEQ